MKSGPIQRLDAVRCCEHSRQPRSAVDEYTFQPFTEGPSSTQKYLENDCQTSMREIGFDRSADGF
jgi:hypothetical protein